MELVNVTERFDLNGVEHAVKFDFMRSGENRIVNIHRVDGEYWTLETAELFQAANIAVCRRHWDSPDAVEDRNTVSDDTEA